jgi:hypothetical protein
MLRMFARMTLNILSNAIGLAAAALLLDGFSINDVSFVIAVIIFSLCTALLGPFIAKGALKNASYLMGGIALVTTLAGLALTSLLSSGISITGASTWILATLVVWIFSIIGNLLLPLILFKKTLEKAKS